MGYESRLYIVKQNKAVDYAEVIARFDFSKMGYGNGWRELFNKPLESKMYAEDGNTIIVEDSYGEKVKYSEFKPVIEWLEEEMKRSNYQRFKPLLSLLNGFNLSEWQDGEMLIVHYGY